MVFMEITVSRWYPKMGAPKIGPFWGCPFGVPLWGRQKGAVIRKDETDKIDEICKNAEIVQISKMDKTYRIAKS